MMKNMIKKLVSLMVVLVVALSMFSFAFAEDDEEGGVTYISYEMAYKMYNEKVSDGNLKFELQFVIGEDNVVRHYFMATATWQKKGTSCDMPFLYQDAKGRSLSIYSLLEDAVFDYEEGVYSSTIVFNDEMGKMLLVEKTQFEEFLAFCKAYFK